MERDVRMQTYKSEKAIIQNLKDAGCDNDMITSFMDDYRNSKQTNALRLLAKHRETLLLAVHNNQKCLDCLDYLIYQMEK